MFYDVLNTRQIHFIASLGKMLNKGGIDAEQKKNIRN